MKDEEKPKSELIEELAKLRQRLAELEQSATEREQRLQEAEERRISSSIRPRPFRLAIGLFHCIIVITCPAIVIRYSSRSWAKLGEMANLKGGRSAGNSMVIQLWPPLSER